MKPSIEIVEDASGHKIVILPDIIFKNIKITAKINTLLAQEMAGRYL